MSRMIRRLVFAVLLSGLLWTPAPAPAELLVFDSPEKWRDWQIPAGLVQIDERGQLRLTQFRKDFNAALNAGRFAHATKTRGDAFVGGIWDVGGGAGTAANLIDGDPTTYWRPSAADDVEKWYVDIDLGRPVLVRQIRLLFPDEEGARPFRQFSVFTATGARIQASDDIYKYNPMYRTTRPNTESEITIPLEYLNTDTTVIIDEGMVLDLERESRYRAIQFVSIEVDEKSPDAALAEVEVEAVGDNIAIGLAQRGRLINGETATVPESMFDGDMNTFGLVTSSHTTSGSKGGWKPAGLWWGADLGASFWLDGLFFYYQIRGEGVSSFRWSSTHAGSGHEILFTDGKQSIQTDLPVPDAFDYTTLVKHDNLEEDGLFQIRYMFKPRKVRHLFWHGITDQGWNTRTMELMIFSAGYPAEVALRSAFLDLGALVGNERPKIIRRVSWDADTPAGTAIQLRSRSGNEMGAIYTFYDKKGEEVTENKWNSLPKVVKGPVDTSIVVGNDWDSWSADYKFSDEAFKSASPRRFVQLELLLLTDDPQVTPELRSLSLEFDDALIRKATGRVLPRRARPNEDTRFTYTVMPSADGLDGGFDVLRLAVPGEVDTDGVQVRIGDETVDDLVVSMAGDSLLIVLPDKVRNDSVSVEFTTRVVQNATVMAMDLGNSEEPHLWQSVEPADDRLPNVIVYLPDLAGSRKLIGDLSLSSQVVTPNDDGVNDEVEIRFVTFKVEAAKPVVQIYDLAGRPVIEIKEHSGESTRVFSWSGRDRRGERVAPGLYFLRVDLGAESGQDRALRSIAVTY